MDSPPRPPASLDWFRAHGLGNDYLVFRGGDALEPDEPRWDADPAAIARVCHRNLGVGSDGIVVVTSRAEPWRLRGFNPDGSEFERSGNGLRVVAAWLHRAGWPSSDEFGVRIAGDDVRMRIHRHHETTGGYDISVEMGRAATGPEAVLLDPTRLDATLRDLDLVPVSIGNPHVVVWSEGAEIDRVGPALERSPAFAEGTNVQVARVAGASSVAIEIWERGVGRTSASGTSSCAAAVAAVATGRLAPGRIDVEMEGGRLSVTVGTDLEVFLRGPVQVVGTGSLDPGFAGGL